MLIFEPLVATILDIIITVTSPSLQHMTNSLFFLPNLYFNDI